MIGWVVCDEFLERGFLVNLLTITLLLLRDGKKRLGRELLSVINVVYMISNFS
jgi:hypothetical protein